MSCESRICAGCLKKIDNNKYIKCCLCNQTYDAVCANVSEKKINSKDTKNIWKCQACKNKQPKICNTNTPIRTIFAFDEGQKDVLSESHDSNITTRKPKSFNSPSISTSTSLDDNAIAAIRYQVLEAIKIEIPTMLSKVIKSELSTLSQEVHDLCKSVSFLSEMHDEMKVKIEELSNDNKSLRNENSVLQTTVTDLSDRINILEQHLRQENLELNGIPEHYNENIPNIIQKCANVIGHNIADDDIVHFTRVAKQNRKSEKPRSIIIKFKNIRRRDEFYSAVYRYNKTHPDNKLNTSLIGMSNEKKPVYVSEHLSPANKALHAAARQKAKELQYKFTWCSVLYAIARKRILYR
ncbi:unnamed protein product, partial [Brenthis ino]